MELLLIPLYFALLFPLRWGMVALLRRQMFAASGSVSEDTAQWDAKPVSAKRPLGFDRLDDRPVAAQAVADRDGLARGARRLFRWAQLMDLGAAVAYMTIVDNLAGGKSGNRWVVALGYASLLTLYVTLLRYPVWRRQYWGDRGWLKDYYGGPLALVERLTDPRHQPYWRGAMAMLALPGAVVWLPGKPLAAAALALVAGLQAVAVIWLYQQARADSALSLLLLRVFGDDRAAGLTFGGLLERWQHIGRHFTVTDAALLRHRHQIFSLTKSLVRGQVMVLAVLGGMMGGSVAVPVVVMVLGLVVEGVLMYRDITRQRVSSDASVVARLDKLVRQPRGADLRFRSFEAPCFDDTWRVAVAAMAHRAQVILMDLRAYTPERTGCGDEVDFLFDQVPLAKVVFLVAPQRLGMVEDLLQSRWQDLDRASPNLGLQRPVAQLFVAGAQAEDDMQRLQDELIAIACRSVADDGRQRQDAALPPLAHSSAAG